MEDKNSGLVNVDLQPLADVTNNVIDKFSKAVGWIATPKGAKKDMDIAVETYIKGIQEDATLPPILKSAKIASARKEIKEYINLQAILQDAQEFMLEYNDNELDEDWAMYFYDKAKNISDKDVRLILSKLLAQECNNKECVSKALVNTISLMDHDLAKSFNKLCKCLVYIEEQNGNKDIEALITTIESMEEHKIPVNFQDIVNLTSIGLIEYSQIGEYGYNTSRAKIKYGMEEFEIESSTTNIMTGHVNLTKTGRELVKMVIPEADEDYLLEIKRYFMESKLNII